MAKSMDHRWGERFNCDAEVELRSTDGSRSRAMLRDVSLSGALIEWPRGNNLLDQQVSLRVPAPTARWMRAFVVRSTDQGMAVEWFEPGVEALSAFIPTATHLGELPLSQHRTLTYMHDVAGVA